MTDDANPTGPPAGDEMPTVEMTVGTRDPEEVRERLTRWIADRLPAGADPRIPDLGTNSANGLSSETLLFDLEWNDDGGANRTEPLVARIAPDEANEPVFAGYDLAVQYDAMRLVGELTDVPVPTMRWIEPSAEVIGSPFFLMERIDGIVPPDVMPYNFGDSWLYDATVEEQRRLQDSTVKVLADLHAIDDPARRFPFLVPSEGGDTPLRRHVAHTRAWYEFAAARAKPSVLAERAFAWLDEHWPEEDSLALSWGDSRIGNVMYRDFEPVAVLDWEMASLGPRELDLGWLVFAHKVFEHIAGQMGLGGMPHFLRTEDVAETYEQLSGYAPHDLDFYLVYAGLQWCVVFMRTGTRQVHFGEIPMPDTMEDLMHHRGLLESLLDA